MVRIELYLTEYEVNALMRAAKYEGKSPSRIVGEMIIIREKMKMEKAEQGPVFGGCEGAHI